MSFRIAFAFAFDDLLACKCQIVFGNILCLRVIWDLHAISHSSRIEMTIALSLTHPSDSLASMSMKADDGWLMDSWYM